MCIELDVKGTLRELKISKKKNYKFALYVLGTFK